MRDITFTIKPSTAGGLVVQALGVPIFGEAASEDDAREKVRDALVCHYREEERPARVHLRFIREETLEP